MLPSIINIIIISQYNCLMYIPIDDDDIMSYDDDVTTYLYTPSSHDIMITKPDPQVHFFWGQLFEETAEGVALDDGTFSSGPPSPAIKLAEAGSKLITWGYRPMTQTF